MNTTAFNCPYVVLHRDTVHHVRATLPETLTRMGEKDMKEHLPASVTTCKMVYIPNIGYLLAITGWNPSPADNVDMENLEFKFVSNNIRYYKSPSAKGYFLIFKTIFILCIFNLFLRPFGIKIDSFRIGRHHRRYNAEDK